MLIGRRPPDGNWRNWPRPRVDRQLSRAEADGVSGCPFCHCHRDDKYVHYALVDVPICEGCECELHIFAEEEGRRNDHVIDAVERCTGRPWAECRVVLLNEVLVAPVRVRLPTAERPRTPRETPR